MSDLLIQPAPPLIVRKQILSAEDLDNLATSSPDEMKEIAARICRDYLNGAWKTITSEEIQLKRISGGLSNFLFHVSLPDKINNNFDKITTTTTSNNKVKRIRTDSLNNMVPVPKEVLLRIYGQTHGEQALETVLTDTVVFTLLSERKLGPKLHGIFPGGRIEQYIPARPLLTAELGDPKISCTIAQKMALIHGLNIPVSKEPEWLWKTLERWLDSAETILSTFKSDNESEQIICSQMREIDLRKELNWLKKIVIEENSPVVFSHNDLQEGNILLKEGTCGSGRSSSNAERLSPTFFDDSTVSDTTFDQMVTSPDTGIGEEQDSNDNLQPPAPVVVAKRTKSRKRLFSGDGDNNVVAGDNSNNDSCDLESTRDSVLSGNSQTFSDDIINDNCDNTDPAELMIIDFEYCAYNYRGFDLANHFLEWTMDYTNPAFPFFYHKKEQYPTEQQQELFISTYLQKVVGLDNYSASCEEIDELMSEVRCFTLVSHYLWTLWSIVNCRQPIEFGYWNYGESRIKEYFWAKDEYNKSKGLEFKRNHTLDERRT